MKRPRAAYVGTMIVMVGLDLLWLDVLAKPMYQRGIGHLMSDKPNIQAAVLFYALFGLWLVVFAVLPAGPAPGWSRLWVRRQCLVFLRMLPKASQTWLR